MEFQTTGIDWWKSLKNKKESYTAETFVFWPTKQNKNWKTNKEMKKPFDINGDGQAIMSNL